MLFICIAFAAGICSEAGQLAAAKEWLLASRAIAMKNAGQRAECREFTHFCRFNASTFCVICLWRREEIVVWCLALVEGGLQGLFVGVDCSC